MTRPGPTTNRTRRAPRVSSDATARAGDRTEQQYDLLTATLMGVAVGAGITYMLRRGPTGRRPIIPALEGAGRGLKWAGAHAWKAGSRGAKWAGDQGEELWDRVPREEIRRGMGRAMHSARDSMEDLVESELRSMRKALRRRRKQLGL